MDRPTDQHSPHAGRPASQRASCSPPGLDARWRIGGELHLNAVMEKKDGEVRHCVMFEAGHLTLRYGSAMASLLFVIDEARTGGGEACVSPGLRSNSISVLRTSFATSRSLPHCSSAGQVWHSRHRVEFAPCLTLVRSSEHVALPYSGGRGRMQSDRDRLESMLCAM